MMRGAGGVLVLTVLLVSCSADSRRKPEVSGKSKQQCSSSDVQYDETGHKPGNLDPLGSGGNLEREVRQTRRSEHIPYMDVRRFYFPSPYRSYSQRYNQYYPCVPTSEYGQDYRDGYSKRSLDEIDRSGLDSFVEKRNIDKMGQAVIPISSLDKRSLDRLDNTMDEIDLSQLPIDSSRSQDSSQSLR